MCSSVKFLFVVVFGDMFKMDGFVEVLFCWLLFMYGSDLIFCLMSVVGGVMLMIFVLFG